MKRNIFCILFSLILITTLYADTVIPDSTVVFGTWTLAISRLFQLKLFLAS